MQLQLSRRHRHHTHRKRGIDEGPEIHRSQRDQEPRIHGQQQQKIHFTGPHQLGKVRAVRQEKRLIELLDEITRADEQNHLPFCP